MKRTDFRPNNNSSSMTDKQRKLITSKHDLYAQSSHDKYYVIGKDGNKRYFMTKLEANKFRKKQNERHAIWLNLYDVPRSERVAIKKEEIKVENSNKKYITPKDTEINSVSLGDDGSLDTIVYVNGKEMRYETEFASQFRNKKGEITNKGWKELKKQAIDDYKNDISDE